MYLLLREKESSCCGKSRCGTCSNLSFVTEKIDQINHDFDCDSRCIVYLLSCKVCGLQYVGSTVDRFRLRWNNYKCSQRVPLEGGAFKQNYFHQHFLSEDHHRLLEDCKIMLIDKTDSSDPTRREFFWMYELKTFATLGLNICEIV